MDSSELRLDMVEMDEYHFNFGPTKVTPLETSTTHPLPKKKQSYELFFLILIPYSLESPTFHHIYIVKSSDPIQQHCSLHCTPVNSPHHLTAVMKELHLQGPHLGSSTVFLFGKELFSIQKLGMGHSCYSHSDLSRKYLISSF